MKKGIIALVVAIMMLLCLSACVGVDPEVTIESAIEVLS